MPCHTLEVLHERRDDGACGIDCETCGLSTYPTDAKAAEEVLNWFHSEGQLKAEEGLDVALERKMFCTGCHGPRDTHWSADCWIRQCAVDQRGLEDCSQCAEFPCARLVAWGTENEGYAAGLERLRGLAAAGYGCQAARRKVSVPADPPLPGRERAPRR